MKITVLVENSTSCRLYGEHGLSVYIEYDGKKYLLDTGASTLFAKMIRRKFICRTLLRKIVISVQKPVINI